MKAKNSRICIIGAGPAGLSAAYFMKERGYTKVTVLEAADRVGGKCRTVECEGRSFDIGANYITAAYREVRRFAKMVDAKLYVESPGAIARIAPSGKVIFSNPFAAIASNRTFLRFIWAALRYLFIRFRLRDIIDRPGFANASKHAGLCLSFREWLSRNKLSALEPMFEIPITIMGYGYLDEIPAPYALKYLSLETYWNLIIFGLGLPRRWPKRFVRGFEDLWRRVATHLDVRLNVDIAAIDRRAPIRVQLRQGEVLEYDYLVLACPLDAGSLGSILALSGDETDLFRRIVPNKYAVTSYAMPNLRLPRRIVGMLPVPELGHPWAFTQQFPDCAFVQFYTRLDDGRNDGRRVAKDGILDAIRQLITALGTDVPEHYLTYNEWNFFPHVGVDDIRNGFYDRLEELQGRSNTYYCGGLIAFELVETVVEYSRGLVESHF